MSVLKNWIRSVTAPMAAWPLVAAVFLAGAAHAQTLSPKLEVSLPNGYAVQTSEDLWAQSPQGSSRCGDIDLLEIAKDCAVDCLWSMLPIPDPCGKFGKLLSVVAGGMGGSSGPNSFTGETVVHIRDANGRPALKPIAQIRIGDEVLAWDEAAVIDGQLSQASPLGQKIQAKTGSIARPASASRYEKVSGVITSEVQQKLVHITLEDGKSLTATAGHPFRTDEGWRDAILLKRGGKLLLKGSGDADPDGQAGSRESASAIRTATVAQIHIETKTVRVFNLEVESLHTFFVGDDGYVVHNGLLSRHCWTDGKGREQIAERYANRKEAKRAAKNSQPGLWSDKSDRAHRPGERPHFHDRNHNRSNKPNVHYEW